MVGCNEHDNETSDCTKRGKELPDFQCLPLSLIMDLTFRHRASSVLGQAFRYSPENAFYIFNQQIYFII